MKSEQWKGDMQRSKIGAKGQVTIPKKIRDVLDIQPGDTVCYLVEQDGVIIKKMGGIKDIKAMVEYDGPAVSIEDMDDAVLEYADRKA